LLLVNDKFLKLDLNNVVIIGVNVSVGLELDLEIFIVGEDSVVVENSESDFSDIARLVECVSENKVSSDNLSINGDFKSQSSSINNWNEGE
jgi:hypothetical protein